ncbi:MAG: ATP-binding protein [Planctomycetota bacterium]|jgi:SpoVK/Ycf46/Vps4 family AAA+-type ATPase
MGKCNAHNHERFRSEGMPKEKRLPATWEDLNLPQVTIGRLKEICCQFKRGKSVPHKSDPGKDLTGGNDRSAIFVGPSGASKTLAAEIIARELAMGLTKVYLSRVIGKYIGETEKNLAKVFAKAERDDAILFFDEVDTLFEKRTEHEDERARYANQVTSYLLEQIERYSGVVLLASNFKKNLDEAFIRRFQSVVEFRSQEEEVSSNKES